MIAVPQHVRGSPRALSSLHYRYGYYYYYFCLVAIGLRARGVITLRKRVRGSARPDGFFTRSPAHANAFVWHVTRVVRDGSPPHGAVFEFDRDDPCAPRQRSYAAFHDTMIRVYNDITSHALTDTRRRRRGPTYSTRSRWHPVHGSRHLKNLI